MTSACPAWVFAVDTHLLRLRHLQNKVLRTRGNIPRRTQIRDCVWFSTFSTDVTLFHNYADSKQKSFKFMKMQLFAT